MSGRYTGKVVLVVGGGFAGPEDHAIGIGSAISRHFAREGARVAVLDNDKGNAERTLVPLKKEGGDAFPITADVGIAEDCKRAVDEVISQAGRLDVLVNNVALGTAAGGLDPNSVEAFDRIWAVNFRSQVLMARFAAPHMPRGSSIINIGSVFGAIDPIPGAYALSKRAVSLAGTPTLAAQYGKQGIRVNGVTAGYVWNHWTQIALPGKAKAESMESWRHARRDELTALGIEGDAWDIAKVCAFLASDDARWVTGQDIVVDGGYHLLNVFDHTFAPGIRDRLFAKS